MQHRSRERAHHAFEKDRDKTDFSESFPDMMMKKPGDKEGRIFAAVDDNNR